MQVRLRTPPHLDDRSVPQRALDAQAKRAPTAHPPLMRGGGAVPNDGGDASGSAAAAFASAVHLAASAAPARVDGLPIATQAGEASSGELASAATRAAVPTGALMQAIAAQGTTFTQSQGGDGGISPGEAASTSRRERDTHPSAMAMAAATNSAPNAGAVARSAVSAHTDAAAQQIDLRHAETVPAQLAAGAAAAVVADLALRRGGEPAPAEAVERQHGGQGKGGGLQTIAASAVDDGALPGRSGQLATAALTAVGRACFQYTPRLRSERREGRVVLRLQVGRDGRAQAVEIKQGSGDAELDATAVAQARSCAHFSLLDRYGRPVAAVIDLPVQYRLLDEP